jgi:D-tyrosyl-tRNA(Tyr) deacylase
LKVLLQRVRTAAVRVEGRTVARIGPGLLVFLAVERGDGPREADYFAGKTADLRIFADGDGRMNRSIVETGGEALVVSQFTLAASTRRGRRPSYSRAAEPGIAVPLYERFIGGLAGHGVRVERGVFQAMMDVELVNDGPVTVLLEPPPEESAP